MQQKYKKFKSNYYSKMMNIKNFYKKTTIWNVAKMIYKYKKK